MHSPNQFLKPNLKYFTLSKDFTPLKTCSKKPLKLGLDYKVVPTYLSTCQTFIPSMSNNEPMYTIGSLKYTQEEDDNEKQHTPFDQHLILSYLLEGDGAKSELTQVEIGSVLHPRLPISQT